MSTFKPMLAVAVDLEKLRFPLIMQPKLDGIRCVVHEGVAKTRMLKDVPNAHIRKFLSKSHFNGMDGELVTFTGGKLDDFNTIQGNVMRKEGTPNFQFMVFDNFRYPQDMLIDRQEDIISDGILVRVSQQWAINVQEVLDYHTYCVSKGHEGIMIRDPKQPYKFGRSTVKEQTLLKMKTFLDTEAEVIGFTEKMHNGNEATVGELGQTKRSSHKENMVPTGTLGTLTCRGDGSAIVMKDIEFDIGTGFTDALRAELWANRANLIGKTVTFKYQEISKYGVPRFPVFLGFRYDLGELK